VEIFWRFFVDILIVFLYFSSVLPFRFRLQRRVKEGLKGQIVKPPKHFQSQRYSPGIRRLYSRIPVSIPFDSNVSNSASARADALSQEDQPGEKFYTFYHRKLLPVYI
jgi:hypothetical protein